MSTNETPKTSFPAIFLQAIVICLSIILPTLWFIHLERGIFQAAFIAALLGACFLLVLLLIKKRLSGIVFRIACIGWGCIAFLIGGYWICRSTMGDYRSQPLTADHFRNKHAMFLVPHYDDDISLANGVAELYAENGSRVSIVFTINCDKVSEDMRLKEALAAWQAVGISNENIYFLNLGNNWQSMEIDGQTVSDIYHSPDGDVLWTNVDGFSQTRDYAYKIIDNTRNNYVDVIKDFLLDLQPDVIYAVDYDANYQHRTTSLFFEEAMAKLLRENSTYRPTVFKGFCYRTTWYAPYDFADSLNLISTTKPPQRDTEVETPQYPWESRIRLPLLSTGLNRLLTQTSVYDQLREYPSQGATSQTGAIASGDRVYWQRHVDSLLYHADFLVGQGATPLLNDFKLMDSANVTSMVADAGIQPIQEPLFISLPEPIQAKFMGLYDDPRPENQILEGFLELDDGSKIAFGPLNNNGSVTYIPLPDKPFQSLTLNVTAWEGVPGLTEVEAYASDVTAPAEKIGYFMFMDAQENFVYDYYIRSDSGSETFSLYTYPHNAVINPDAFRITKTGSNSCTYSFDGKNLTVSCPQGEHCEITVTYGDITCSMAFSNPGIFHTRFLENLQNFDHGLLHSYAPGSINSQILYYKSFLDKMESMISSIL